MRFVLEWPPLNAPLGLIEVGLIEVSGRAARNSPPTASAVETAATKNEHENDDDQKGSAIHDRLLAEPALRLGMITNPSSNSTREQTLQLTFATATVPAEDVWELTFHRVFCPDFMDF